MDSLLSMCPSTTTLLGTVGVLLVFYVFFSSFDGQRKEPPGPRPLPLIGNLLQLGKPTHVTLKELSKKYGPVFTFNFGPQKMVVLAGHKTIKEALVNNDAFSEKEAYPVIHDLKLTDGIVFANGDSWREMRQFALTNMKDFGMGRKACEDKIIEESQYLMDLFKEENGKAFDPAQRVNNAISNIISSIVYGNRFEYNDPVFVSMVDRATKNTHLMGSPSLQLYNFFPRLFGWIEARKELIKRSVVNRRSMKELIKNLEDTHNPQMCRGFVDSFLARKNQLEASGNMNSHFNENNLLVTVVNLFTAGTDTTAATIRYGLLLMAKYPKIQENVRYGKRNKLLDFGNDPYCRLGDTAITAWAALGEVQEEMSRVIGSRLVQTQDRKNLPYTDAVIHEIQRMANTVPKTIHRTTRDVTFHGYFIKKGTPVLILLSSALYDEDEWETPHSFNPAHFLDKDGNFRKRDAFLPFSAGPRACTGESLARMEVFLFLTSLLQHFRFTPPPGVKEEDLDLSQVEGLTLTPVPHQLCAISRD